MFAPLAKWAATIDDPARIPEYVGRAYRVATAGRPGPVVLSLPEDVLTQSRRRLPTRARRSRATTAPRTRTSLARIRELIAAPPSDRSWSSAAAAGRERAADRRGRAVRVVGRAG